MITLSKLRLEVADPPAGPANRIKNGSGALGTAGWSTPVSGSTLVSSTTSGGADDHGIVGQKLIYSAAGSVANYFTSERVAVTPGQWVAARWEVPYVEDYYRVAFEFLNSAGTVVSTSAYTGYRQADSAESLMRPTVVPAGAIRVRVRFNMYADAAGGNPTAGDDLIVRGLKLAKASTAAELGTILQNLMPNSSAEGGTTFTAPGMATGIIQCEEVAFALDGTQVFVYASGEEAHTVNIPVTAGLSYTARINARNYPGFGLRWVRVAIRWLTAGGTTISTTSPVATTAVEDTWTDAAVTDVAPPTATQMYLILNSQFGTSSPQAQGLDAIMVTPDDPETPYFDGSTPADESYSYFWTGVPLVSSSEAIALVDFIDEPTFTDILGPTHEIKIVREQLDLGTLSATVLDPALDPASSTALRPGRVARVTVDAGAGFEPIATMETDVLKVGYVPDLRISLTAYDAMKELGNAARPEGVESIDDLPYVLEGVDVPWLVNGSSTQVASATVVSVNENAKAVDQVAICRDLGHGFAWVARGGVLVVNDQDNMPDTSVRTISEADYSRIDIGLDTSTVVNSVMVQFLTYTGGGETTVTVYGPYEDAASIEEWGFRSATFTVHMATESEPAIAAFAAAILDANAQPVRRVTSLTIPIRSDADLPKTLLDLCDLVQVQHADTAVDALCRITRIEHEIEATAKRARWVMTLALDAPGFLPLPQVIPSP